MELALKLVDKTPYVWWKEDESTIEKSAPFYCDSIPSIETIQQSGCNCAGLINLLQLSRGLKVPGVSTSNYYAGGTYVWYMYLKKIGALEPIDLKKSYPAGTLLLRRYDTVEDQGHLAVLYSSGPVLEQKLLHCYPEMGVKIDETVKSSNDWLPDGNYYEYVCVNWLYRDLEPPN